MKLIVKRFAFQPDYTIGKMYIDHEDNFDPEWFCDTLEPTVRAPGVKVDGKTAIPEGTYKFKLAYSPANKMNVPLLQDVPGFSEIEIHIGNYPHDTHGCTLVGRNTIKGELTASTQMFCGLIHELNESGQSEWEITYTHS